MESGAPTDAGPVERVGIRELKAQASDIIRRVRDERIAFDVSVRGEVVARISPTSQLRRSTAEREAFWARHSDLVARMGAAGDYQVER